MLSPKERDELKSKVRNNLDETCKKLLYQQPLLAMLMMRLKLVVVIDDRLNTAATDGTHIFVDARFMDEISVRDRLFVLAHEVWHCALGHFVRRHHLTEASREMRLWNVACDYEVNHIVADIVHHVPRFALFDDTLKGYSAEQIYSFLSEKSSTESQNSFDVHMPNQSVNTSHHIGQEIDADYAPSTPSSEDVKRWRHYVVHAAQSVRHQNGTLPKGMEIFLNTFLRPQIPWNEVLRSYVEQSIGMGYSWQRPNRRHLSQGLYLPGHRGEHLNIAVAVDTSGSTEALLPQFFGELYGILRSFEHVRVQLIECDTEVQQHEEFSEHELEKLKTWRPRGLGGTSFTPVFQYIADANNGLEYPKILVFFTDGLGGAPLEAPQYPVLWVLPSDGEPPASWGQTTQLGGLSHALF